MNGKFFMLEALGYDSNQDFINTLFVKYKFSSILMFSIFSAVGIFIEDYVWDDRNAIYFLWLLLLMDLITGIAKAYYVEKSFTSRRLPRWAGVAFSYMTLLWASYNMSKFSPDLFSFLPLGLYGLFLLTQFRSIWENLVVLKLLQGPIVTKINNLFKKIDNGPEK